MPSVRQAWSWVVLMVALFVAGTLWWHVVEGHSVQCAGVIDRLDADQAAAWIAPVQPTPTPLGTLTPSPPGALRSRFYIQGTPVPIDARADNYAVNMAEALAASRVRARVDRECGLGWLLTR